MPLIIYLELLFYPANVTQCVLCYIDIKYFVWKKLLALFLLFRHCYRTNAYHAASVLCESIAIACGNVQVCLLQLFNQNARKSVGNNCVFSLSFFLFAKKEKEKDIVKNRVIKSLKTLIITPLQTSPSGERTSVLSYISGK